MIAIDTGALVRILVDDPGQPRQVEAVRRFASRAQQLFILQVVQVECVWVMESAYRLGKEEIADAMSHLERNSAFILEDEALASAALTLYRRSNVDYADCVILSVCGRRNIQLHTFDKRLGKLTAVIPITAGSAGRKSISPDTADGGRHG